MPLQQQPFVVAICIVACINIICFIVVVAAAVIVSVNVIIVHVIYYKLNTHKQTHVFLFTLSVSENMFVYNYLCLHEYIRACMFVGCLFICMYLYKFIGCIKCNHMFVAF